MSMFSQDEFERGRYRWRKDGKILVTIVSQPFCLRDTKKEKITKVDEEERSVDIDAIRLTQFFKEEKAKFPVNVDLRFDQNCKYDEFVEKYVQVMEKEKAKYEKYDCFFFIFLTYVGEESIDDEKLHFYDKCKPLGEILDEVKKQEVTWGKPKIFLIQADDKTLLGPKTEPKGPTVVKERKIPQDADRLVIQSTIPQGIANRNNTDQNPSFLVQAFMDAMKSNWSLRHDFLSLTTTINKNVDDMINQSGGERKNEMLVPLVTSTLTKTLVF
ncbi:uncharacterized protein LOC123564484 [Mercenaria mercenaria]|uniref:uncharacterized protein LOC123564484 n=1 Tax=Mercenaria mercenaria TaxID=6596 RepID=UPI001E1DC930|nr:uncharacterized protein LOC123564484 [Mercenaria mercenaria]